MSAKRHLASKARRVEGRFIALPHDVVESDAYLNLSHTARSLLLELAMQYAGDNNGRFLLTSKHLRKRGWRSADVICRAKKELLDCELIHETVKGHRPNKASWYAVTWLLLDESAAYDPGAKATFSRGAYRQGNDAAVILCGGVKSRRNAPLSRVIAPTSAPSHVAVVGSQTYGPITPSGTHLEKPSDDVVVSLYGSGLNMAKEEKLKNRANLTEQAEGQISVAARFGGGRL